MKRFLDKQPIKVTDSEHLLYGKTGKVWRLRMGDNAAWVTMDEDLPESLVNFPDPEDSRHRNALLYPDECEVADEPTE